MSDGAETSTDRRQRGKRSVSGPKSKRRKLNDDTSQEGADSNDSSTEVDISTWSQDFRKLDQVFKSLNTVYTFCCTRKHLPTTFENLKSSVENLIKRPLIVDDVVRIKALLPDTVMFDYVDEDKLIVNVDSASLSLEPSTSGTAPRMVTPRESSLPTSVLYFEFIDGELKPKLNRNIGILRDRRDLKLPEFTPAAIARLITKRNQKFRKAVNSHIATCQNEGIDPWLRLIERSAIFFPTRLRSPLSHHSLISSQTTSSDTRSHTIRELIEELKGAEDYRDQIVPGGHLTIPEQVARYGKLSKTLSAELSDALLESRNISELYIHQASAINQLWENKHVIVSTSTASGKSLIYQIPVLVALERDPDVKGLYIFPTKALAQDQKKSLSNILSNIPSLSHVAIETFDGDTPQSERNRIRETASVIFTNPDTLHITIMPNEEKWRTFLKNLKYVVVDELHVYTGLFGSHVAFIMRRLRRLCAAIGNRRWLQFISSTATLPNAKEHMKAIFGLQDVSLVEEDGSPTGRKEFLCWNCPLVDPIDPGAGRVGTISETSRLLVSLIRRKVRAIAFCKVRKVCDVLLRAVRAELRAQQLDEFTNKVMSYRGGYTAQDRRKIEQAMFNGDLLGIIATNALELGVDIGALDAVLIVGFPYTISALRQQSGRAGRRKKDSLTVLIADPYPVDQHFMDHPEELFTKANLEAQVDLGNPLVLEGHLQCAAYEMPLQPSDALYFGPEMLNIAEQRMIKDANGYYHCHPRFIPQPWKHVSIRDIEDDHYVVVDTTNERNTVLEELEPSRAFFTIFEGAIYMHQGNTYLVKELDIDKKMATVVSVNVDWTTRQRDFTNVDPVETHAIRKLSGSSHSAFYGDICVTAVVFGYFKVDKRNNIIDAVDVDNPPVVINTKGMWLDIPNTALEILSSKGYNIAGAIHAAEHAILSLLPNVVIASPGDVRTECKAPQKEYAKRETERKRPARLTFYDAVGKGGAGISSKAFDFVDLLLQHAVERVETCKCLKGCPECVTSPVCKEGNIVTSKIGASVILKSLLNLDIDTSRLPQGDERGICIETVVPVDGSVREAAEIRRYSCGVVN